MDRHPFIHVFDVSFGKEIAYWLIPRDNILPYYPGEGMSEGQSSLYTCRMIHTQRVPKTRNSGPGTSAIALAGSDAETDSAVLGPECQSVFGPMKCQKEVP